MKSDSGSTSPVSSAGAVLGANLDSQARRALCRELRLALLSEFGARAICDHLGRLVEDSALGDSLERVNREGSEVVQEVQNLLRTLGARPRMTSLRRRALARVLAVVARMTGPRLVVRIAQQACETVARWYLQYAFFLAQHGEVELARRCEGLAEIKQRHANSLGAWTKHG